MPGRRDALTMLYRRRLAGGRPTRIEPRVLAYFGVMLVLIGLAGSLYLYQSSEVAAYSREIRELEVKKERLRHSLVSLQAEAASLGALSRVRGFADELGYVLPEAGDTTRRLHTTVTLPTKGAGQTAAAVAPESTQVDTPESGTLSRMMTSFRRWMEEPVEGVR